MVSGGTVCWTVRLDCTSVLLEVSCGVRSACARASSRPRGLSYGCMRPVRWAILRLYGVFGFCIVGMFVRQTLSLACSCPYSREPRNPARTLFLHDIVTPPGISRFSSAINNFCAYSPGPVDPALSTAPCAALGAAMLAHLSAAPLPGIVEMATFLSALFARSRRRPARTSSASSSSATG